MTRKAKKVSTAISLPAAVKSFLGHLEGTGKARHTIQNYKWDLRQFERFLVNDVGTRNPARLDQALRGLSIRDVEKFGDYLKREGQKANTRRRRVLTLRRFIRYTVNRKKLGLDVAARVPAPDKIERVPVVLNGAEVLRMIDQITQSRDRAIYQTIWETGCTVSELVRLKWRDVEGHTLTFGAASSYRQLRISSTLKSYFDHLRPPEHLNTASPVFTAQRGGVRISSLAMSPRAVEQLFNSYSKRFGPSSIVPRTLRHSAILTWLRDRVSTDEIKKRLGLKSDYAFRIYQPLVKSEAMEQDQ
ncbi:MAG: site-specific integrase [Bdellovibrionota bacterium]